VFALGEGWQLTRIIEQMEAGNYPLPSVPVWRGDLPRDLAIRIACATGADPDELTAVLESLGLA
jgi:hypothetical protein